MPKKGTVRRGRKAAGKRKAASTRAGKSVQKEIRHVRRGKHGARSAKQAVAIGLSKARRAGVKVKPPKKRSASAATRRKATSDYRAGQRVRGRKASSRRSSASRPTLKRGRKAASRSSKTAKRHSRSR